MKFGYIIYLAASSLRMRKLRSFLTIGGMAIGIGAIVFLVSLGFGLQALIVSRVTNVAAITVLDVSVGASTILKINEESLKKFRALPNVISVSSSISQSGQVVRGESVTDIALYGVQAQYPTIEGVVTNFGTTSTSDDEQSAIVSATAAELLGAKVPQDLLGQKVTMRIVLPDTGPVEQERSLVNTNASTANTNGNTNTSTSSIKTKDVEVKIVGIVPSDNSLAYMPLKIFTDAGITNFNLARVKLDTRENLAAARTAIEAQGYQVDSVADTVGQIDRIFFIFQIVMFIFGLIAMLIASLGAFNTLTVSLLERTREVGIMKSLGTTSRHIYILFLSEALLIGVLGGISGLIVGTAFGELVNYIINRLAARLGGQAVDLFTIPFIFLLIIAGIIILVGLITGLYPARRAAKINALDALRYE
ncbi:MAG: FtsX-like permease family protein [Patescibacteria group bacterium]|jgi:putative ABC transport system permease protein